MAECRARLERHAGDAIDVKVHGHDVIRARKSLLRCRRVAEEGVDENVALDLVPDRGRARRHRLLGVEDRGQHLVGDLDRLGGIERGVDALGHDHGDRFSDMAHLVGGEKKMRPDEQRSLARGGELHVVTRLGQRVVGDRAEPVRGGVGAGEDAEHARHGFGARGIDRDDARVRVGRADHRRAGLSVEMEVVAEAAAPGDEPRILRAHARLADRLEARRVDEDAAVVHRGFLHTSRFAGGRWRSTLDNQREYIEDLISMIEIA